MFSEIEYSIQQQDLIEALDSNSALQVAILEPDVTIMDTYESCIEAAQTAIKVFDNRIFDYFKTLAFRGKILPADMDKRYKLYTYPDILPIGEKISFNQFIGEGLDIDTLTTTGSNLFHQNSNKGLIYALFCDPHSSGNIIGEKYDNLIRKFFSAFLSSKENYIIYQLSNDWSNYFDAGKEWWGTFFWTLYDKTTNQITVIAASITD